MSRLDDDRTILIVSDLHCTSGIDTVSARSVNTGTRMGVLEAGEQLHREMHQFTFLQVTPGPPISSGGILSDRNRSRSSSWKC